MNCTSRCQKEGAESISQGSVRTAEGLGEIDFKPHLLECGNIRWQPEAGGGEVVVVAEPYGEHPSRSWAAV